MRAVLPLCGHAQAEEQHRGGHTRPSARALKIGTRHQARCRSRKSQVPCRLGPVSGDFGGAHVFFALKRPFPPSRPSTRPQLGATALKFHKNLHHEKRHARPLAVAATMGDFLLLSMPLR